MGQMLSMESIVVPDSPTAAAGRFGDSLAQPKSTRVQPPEQV